MLPYRVFNLSIKRATVSPLYLTSKSQHGMMMCCDVAMGTDTCPILINIHLPGRSVMKRRELWGDAGCTDVAPRRGVPGVLEYCG